MRIGIYTNVLAQKPSGIGWHVIHLLEHLAAIDRENEYFLFYRVSPGKRNEPRFKPSSNNFQNVPVVAPGIFYQRYFRVFERYLLPRAIAAKKIDLFHGPNHYLPPPSGIRQVVTYHDLAEAKFNLTTAQDQAGQAQAVKRCLARADRVIAISQCTRADVVEFGFPVEKIDVIYQGGNFDQPRIVDPNVVAAARRAFGVERDYILFVSSLVPRKNVSFLLRAFALLQGKLPGRPQLVLAGASDTPEAARLAQEARALGVSQDLVMTGYLNNNQIGGLYGGARVFVLPSLYEGFGMPVLEAMAHRLPVIAAAAGSLPEVVGDAGLLVNLGDEPALAEAIRRLFTDEALRAALADKGVARLRDFDWKTTATQTLAVYRKTME